MILATMMTVKMQAKAIKGRRMLSHFIGSHQQLLMVRLQGIMNTILRIKLKTHVLSLIIMLLG